MVKKKKKKLTIVKLANVTCCWQCEHIVTMTGTTGTVTYLLFTTEMLFVQIKCKVNLQVWTCTVCVYLPQTAVQVKTHWLWSGAKCIVSILSVCDAQEMLLKTMWDIRQHGTDQ